MCSPHGGCQDPVNAQLRAIDFDYELRAHAAAEEIARLKAENEALRNFPLGVANEYSKILSGEISKADAERFQQRMNLAMELHRRMAKAVQS